LPVERDDVTSCAEGATGTPIGGLPPLSGAFSGPRYVTAVTRDAAGCRVFQLEESPPPNPRELLVCLADDSYPFAATDTLVATSTSLSPAGTIPSGVRIDNGNGVTLDLVRFAIEPRQTLAFHAELSFRVDSDPTCATVRDPCGDVEVPLAIAVTQAGETVTRPVLGTSIAHPTDPRRALYVLAAFAHPIIIGACAGRPLGEQLTPAEVFVAFVERP
jgi:hypothetical protein